jgi:hypothetical protein
MPTYASGYSNGYRVRIEHFTLSQNWDNNTSVVRSELWIDATSTWFNARLNGDHYNNGALVWNPGGGNVNLGGLGSHLMSRHDIFVGHDSNGNASASSSGYAQTVSQGFSWSMPYLVTSGSYGLARIPQFPSAPTSLTFSRSVRNVTVSTSGASGNGGSILEYRIERTTANQTAWSGVFVGNGGTFTDLAPGASYRFRSQARTDRGWGPFADIGGTVTIPTVPSAPASVTINSQAGLSLSVTVGASASNGGEGISSYTLQFTSNGGTTWTTHGTVTAGSATTVSGLTPGLTYQFRAFSTNAIGDSATTASANWLLVVGGKRWDGTAWRTNTVARRWDGTAWRDLSVARRWNGSSWVNLT